MWHISLILLIPGTSENKLETLVQNIFKCDHGDRVERVQQVSDPSSAAWVLLTSCAISCVCQRRAAVTSKQ